MVAVEVEKAYAEEAKQRQGNRNDINIPVNSPECKGDARDKAAEMLNVYNAFSEGRPNGFPIDYLNAESKAQTHATKTQNQSKADAYLRSR